MNLYQKKTKILFITSLLDRIGGAEKNLCEIVLNLNKDKFTPIVLAFKGGYLTKFLAGKKIAVSENGIKKLISWNTLINAIDLWRFIRTEQIDVVVTYHHDADIFGSVVAKLAGVRRIISSRRDMGYQLQKKHVWFYRWCGWLFSHFITVSDAVKFKIINREGVSAGKITTIHNGLDVDKFRDCGSEKKKALRKELGLAADKITIGMVASFRPIKGHEYLVEAVGTLIDKFPDIQVVIVGYNDTDYFEKVFARIVELNLQSYFIFTGSRNDVPDLLNLFDIFVISSLHEGFSNAIIEAMAAGKPVIAPDSGGNCEAVEQGETGFLFKPCDSSSLAEKLNEILDKPGLRIAMGKKGRIVVEKKFRLDQMVAKNEKLLNEIINE
jgi:glycosyltransferase involved in cell wall biosynthesis